MIRDNFAVFILAHGRPEKMFTVKTLKKQGYTGKYYIILDDEDDKIQEYKDTFGEDHIVVFDKVEAGKKFDIMDNFDGRNVIVFARNVCFDIARDLGLNYFAEFEDDYLGFMFREEIGTSLKTHQIKDLDSVFDSMLEFLDNTTNVRTIAFAQTGEMMGGVHGAVWATRLKRKAMNTFFFKVCNPEDDFYFLGRMNDDVNAYTMLGMRGEVFLQIADVNLVQVLTQKSAGGNTTAYKQFGTYVKSFYSVMGCPSSVKVAELGVTSRRIHHTVDWEHTVPKIISSKFKKNYKADNNG